MVVLLSMFIEEKPLVICSKQGNDAHHNGHNDYKDEGAFLGIEYLCKELETLPLEKVHAPQVLICEHFFVLGPETDQVLKVYSLPVGFQNPQIIQTQPQ